MGDRLWMGKLLQRRTRHPGFLIWSLWAGERVPIKAAEANTGTSHDTLNYIRGLAV